MINKKYDEKRERILNAVNFKPVDRLPYGGSTCTIASIESITGRNDYVKNAKEVYAQAMKTWDVDIVHQFVLPDRQDKQVGPKAGVDLWNGLLSVLYKWMDKWVKEHGGFKSPEDVRDFCITIPDVSDAAKYVDDETSYKRWVELDAWGEFLKPVVWMPGHSCGTVGWMWYEIMGYENFLMAHLLYSEELERLFAFAGEEGYLINIAIARAIRENNLLPMVYSGEDICGNDGPLASPDILRQIYFPHLKHAVSPLVNDGIHWLWHTDGNIALILPDILDCGIDGFQGFEEDKGMDMLKLAETPCKNGNLPFLRGSVNVTTTMYTSPGEIKADVKRVVDLSNKRGGGIILSSSSSIMENTPTENVLALFEACANQGTI